MSELAMQFRITNRGREALKVIALKADGETWNVSQEIVPGNTFLVTATGRKSEDQFEFDIDEQGLTLWTWSDCQAIKIERDE